MFIEIEDPVLFNNYPFTFKQLLHQVFMAKMVFTGQYAIAVDNTVRGKAF